MAKGCGGGGIPFHMLRIAIHTQCRRDIPRLGSRRTQAVGVVVVLAVVAAAPAVAADSRSVGGFDRAHQSLRTTPELYLRPCRSKLPQSTKSRPARRYFPRSPAPRLGSWLKSPSATVKSTTSTPGSVVSRRARARGETPIENSAGLDALRGSPAGIESDKLGVCEDALEASILEGRVADVGFVDPPEFGAGTVGIPIWGCLRSTEEGPDAGDGSTGHTASVVRQPDSGARVWAGSDVDGWIAAEDVGKSEL
ncbi:hypothetical protein C8F01DRAFT_322425 [Mycena amicta]|nr:hypothetical protein C8F01DRAFT_322425 [Mycena amicta]